jgi:GlcNAc-PI de-N-acetylase
MTWIPRAWLVAVLSAWPAARANPNRATAVRYQSNGTADVVIVAHEDDWQLFMGDLIAGRVEAGASVSFIYLTAGDDGRDSTYWVARERAALLSTRVLSVAVAEPGNTAEALCAKSVVRGHSIKTCTVGRTVSYFLRLPDGRRDGAGFARYGKQSLRKLRRNAIGSITTVDGSASYKGWPELAATVTELVQANEAGALLAVHTTDPSIAINPHDHFDHRMAGLLVEDLRKVRGWDVWYYVGYALGTRAANRSADRSRQKTALFRAYDDEMIRANPKWSAYAEHPAFYSQCMVRTYVRRARR